MSVDEDEAVVGLDAISLRALTHFECFLHAAGVMNTWTCVPLSELDPLRMAAQNLHYNSEE